MTSRAEALFVDLEGEASYRPAWMRSSYNFQQLSWTPVE